MARPLEEIADELYSLPPDEFTRARNDRGKEAKGSDSALAAAVLALRKPSAAAWVSNMLVRHRADEVEEALDLGAELQDAQSDLDRAGLAALTRQRRQLVSAIARQGSSLAEELGHRVTAAVIDEVSQTLQAAMTDPDAAAALLTGRLVRGLATVGFEPVDLDGAVAVPEAGTRAARAAAPASGPGAPKRDDAAKRALEEAREAVAATASRAREAARTLDEIDRRMVRLGQRHDQLAEERDDLEEQLRAVKADIVSADREARSLDREHDRAAAVADSARDDADAAQARLTDLDGR